MSVVLECPGHSLELSSAFDEHVLPRIHQNVAHRLVSKQRLEGSEAKDLVQDISNDRITLFVRKLAPSIADEGVDNRTDLALRHASFGRGQGLEIEPREQLTLNAALEAQVLLVSRSRYGRDRLTCLGGERKRHALLCLVRTAPRTVPAAVDRQLSFRRLSYPLSF